MNIGERLRFLREQSGISGKALAEKIGLVPSQINKIEHNVTKPSIDSLERICGALGITLGEFFSAEKLEVEPELLRLLQTAKKLTPAEREKLIELIDLMKNS
jgi:transcriptional regulator with XRE-family HTH domain